MSGKPVSKSVFVGNIPYGLTEEQIIDIFSSAGKVVNFRLVFDRETGRPKGFGFVEYPDQDSASSAVRNLNDYEIMNRKLRVDFSNDGAAQEDDGQQQQQSTHMNFLPNTIPQNGMGIAPPPNMQQNGSSLPPLPQGVDIPPGLTCPDAISRTLNTLPQRQLLDVLSQMKVLATTDPEKAAELLHQAPQLSYAIFQALLLMGLVSIDAMRDVVEGASATQAPPPPVQNYSAPGAYPPGFPPPPPHMSGQLGAQIGTPPPSQYGYPPPPPPQQRAPPVQQQAPEPQNLNNLDELMAQVLAMPQHMIDGLPPAEREQIMQLRASAGR